MARSRAAEEQATRSEGGTGAGGNQEQGPELEARQEADRLAVCAGIPERWSAKLPRSTVVLARMEASSST